MRGLLIVVLGIAFGCARPTRLWLTDNRAQHDCVARCRDANRGSRVVASSRLTACIAECPGVEEEDGTCRVDEDEEDVCVAGERLSAGRTVALVAAVSLGAIAALFIVFAVSCRPPECEL